MFERIRKVRRIWALERDVVRLSAPGTVGPIGALAMAAYVGLLNITFATALSPLEGWFLMIGLGISRHAFGWPGRGLGYGAAVGLADATDVLAVRLFGRSSHSPVTNSQATSS